MEQELASIFSFVLKAADSPQPYYENVPEDFFVPAAYFAVPEIITYGDTLNSYAAEYSWYVNFMHTTTQEAYKMGLKAITAIKENRNLIPLLDIDGNKTGKGVRVNDPDLKVLDNGVVRLIIRFVSRRPYKEPDTIKMQVNKIFMKFKGGI